MEYREMLGSSDEGSKEEPEPVKFDFDPALRWPVERTTPIFAIDEVSLKGFRLAVSDATEKSDLPQLTRIDAEGRWISTMPGWNEETLRLGGKGELNDGNSGAITFLAKKGSPFQWELRLDNVPLKDVRSLYEESLPVLVKKGTVTIESVGSIDDGKIDSTQNLKLEHLKIAATPGEEEILGLDAKGSQYAIQGINAYGEKLPIVVGVGISGSASSPKVDADLPFLEVAKKGLEMMGRKELDKYIGQIDGQIGSIKEAGLSKVVPLEGDFQETFDAGAKALETGDFSDLEKAVDKTKKDLEDVKDLKDTKDELKDKVDDVLDIFKKKKKKKKKKKPEEEKDE
jgi:hypothetical protein